MQTTMTTRPSTGVEKTFDARPPATPAASTTASLSLAKVLAGIETKLDAYTSHAGAFSHQRLTLGNRRWSR